MLAVLLEVARVEARELRALRHLGEHPAHRRLHLRRGDVEVDLLQEQLHRLVLAAALLALHLRALHRLAHGGLELVKGLRLRLLGERRVVRQHAAAESLERHGVDRLRAGEPLGRALLGELGGDLLLGLARLHALHRVEDLGQEAPLLELGPEALALGDDLRLGVDLEDLLPADRALVVNLPVVALGRRVALLAVLERRVGRAQLVDPLVDLRVLHRRVRVGDLEPLVGGELELGAHVDDRRVRAAIAVEVELLHAHQRDLVHALGLQRLGVELAHHRRHRLLLQLAGEAAADHLDRHLALAEARQLGVAHELALDGLHDLRLLGGVQLHLQLDAALALFLLARLHCLFSIVVTLAGLAFRPSAGFSFLPSVGSQFTRFLSCLQLAFSFASCRFIQVLVCASQPKFLLFA